MKYQRKVVIIEECEFDDELKTTVHRFNMGQRMCRCGNLDVPKSIYETGVPWRRPREEGAKPAGET